MMTMVAATTTMAMIAADTEGCTGIEVGGRISDGTGVMIDETSIAVDEITSAVDSRGSISHHGRACLVTL